MKDVIDEFLEKGVPDEEPYSSFIEILRSFRPDRLEELLDSLIEASRIRKLRPLAEGLINAMIERGLTGVDRKKLYSELFRRLPAFYKLLRKDLLNELAYFAYVSGFNRLEASELLKLDNKIAKLRRLFFLDDKEEFVAEYSEIVEYLLNRLEEEQDVDRIARINALLALLELRRRIVTRKKSRGSIASAIYLAEFIARELDYPIDIKGAEKKLKNSKRPEDRVLRAFLYAIKLGYPEEGFRILPDNPPKGLAGSLRAALLIFTSYLIGFTINSKQIDSQLAYMLYYLLKDPSIVEER